MAIYVGTSGWSYPRGEGRWDGVFYPPTLLDRDKLPFYARYFGAVEINSSFYRPPAASLARSWVSRTPPKFRFAVKLWQKFTHPKMFEEATGTAAEVVEQDYQEFIRGILPLAEAGKLGPVLAQFPPSFRPSWAALEYLEDLGRRLRSEGFRLAVELRHREWTEDNEIARALRAFLESEQIAWAMIDEPKFRTSIGEVPLTSEVGYFRFHGRNYERWWRHEAAEDRYNYLYTAEEQQELARDVRQVAERAGETYVFYNNHYRAKAVVNALEMRELLGQRVGAALPTPLVAEYPALAELVPMRRE